MTDQPVSPARPKGGVLEYVMAILGFIPFAGVPFALLAIILGLVRNRMLALVLGLAGLGVSAGVGYWSMHKIFTGNGPFAKAWVEIAKVQINGLVPLIEYY